MKYKYHMGGSFTPQNKEYLTRETILGIDIPCPFERDSEKDAMKDGFLTYRFGFDDALNEPVIFVFEKEGFAVDKDDSGQKCLKVWPVGNMIKVLTHKEFVEKGGYIFNFPEPMICQLPVSDEELTDDQIVEEIGKWREKSKNTSWNIEDYKIKASFKELFPDLKSEDKLVYVDNDSYGIEKIG